MIPVQLPSPTAPEAPSGAATRIIPSAMHLAWLDLEMSGLDPEQNRILEMAVIITDSDLQVVAEGPVLVVHHGDEVLTTMDEWNTKTHGKSGLAARVRASTLTEAQAEAEMLAFIACYIPQDASPLCGNTVHQDRRFLTRWMPKLDRWFHYRHLDVSTLKLLCKRWRPDLYKGLKKAGRHEALADIYESIEEMRYYREHFLRADLPETWR